MELEPGDLVIDFDDDICVVMSTRTRDKYRTVDCRVIYESGTEKFPPDIKSYLYINNDITHSIKSVDKIHITLRGWDEI